MSDNKLSLLALGGVLAGVLATIVIGQFARNAARVYPAGFDVNFMESCELSASASRCTCALNVVHHNYPKYDPKLETDKELQDSVAYQCR